MTEEYILWPPAGRSRTNCLGAGAFMASGHGRASRDNGHYWPRPITEIRPGRVHSRPAMNGTPWVGNTNMLPSGPIFPDCPRYPDSKVHGAGPYVP